MSTLPPTGPPPTGSPPTGSPPTGRPQRILAVDFGDARTGLAATDWTGSIVVPLGRVDERDEARLIAAIGELVTERQTQVVVVGMPLAQDGTLSARALRTMAFCERLAKALPCPVHTVDESGSTDEAHDRLRTGGLKASRRKRLADSVAALVILERYRSSPRG